MASEQEKDVPDEPGHDDSLVVDNAYIFEYIDSTIASTEEYLEDENNFKYEVDSEGDASRQVI